MKRLFVALYLLLIPPLWSAEVIPMENSDSGWGGENFRKKPHPVVPEASTYGFVMMGGITVLILNKRKR